MTALVAAFAACLVAALACWVTSLVTCEVSWVDRLWSVLPPAYVVGYLTLADAFDARLALVTLLVVAWGARLTFNFARKGGYAKGGEDYRWSVLRSRMSPLAFHFFNFGFVALYQNILLFLLTLPAWLVLQSPAPLGWLDGVATVLFLGALAGETVADQQQWNFHRQKAARKARGETGPDFLTTGLFRFSRHPNFFFEQAQWWILYLFAVSAGAGILNPALVGPVLLTLLFLGSTRFTEQITVSKYPAYRDYQKQVSMLIPWFSSLRPSAASPDPTRPRA